MSYSEINELLANIGKWTLGFALFSIPLLYVQAKLRTIPGCRNHLPQDKLVLGPFTLGCIVGWIFMVIWLPLMLIISVFCFPRYLEQSNDINMLLNPIFYLSMFWMVGYAIVEHYVDKYYG